MRKFKVVLTNGSEDLDLEFAVRNSSTADKWYDELRKNYDLYEIDRFSDWTDDFCAVIEELNQQIDIINNYEYIIDRKIKEDPSQEELNYLHKFFENLRGEVFEMTAWYKQSPEEIKKAVERFNVLIHQLESTLRTKNKHPTLVVTFRDSPRFDLAEEDYENFTYRWTSGTVYINYCQVGKTVLDVFKDKDHIAEIRPQAYYSADFMIKFGPSTNLFVYLAKTVLLKFWLSKQKLKFKHLSLGMIPVADMTTSIARSSLSKYTRVKRVECIK